jgi:hypothetical protein
MQQIQRYDYVLEVQWKRTLMVVGWQWADNVWQRFPRPRLER